MISDELLDKFDRIEDLPVSEELLGAYMEGNLNSFETSQMENIIAENAQLSDLVDDISQDNISNILNNLEPQIFDPSYPVFISDLQLPDLGGDYNGNPFYEDYAVAVCDSRDFLGDTNHSLTDDMVSTDHLIEKNFSTDDSFLSSGQSLDIESHESDDVFNDDSIDI